MNKMICLIIGFLSIGLAAIGAVMPLIPTTPFVLLSAFCFSKSSNRFHSWLVNNKFFGPVLVDWQKNRGMRMKTKVTALLSIILIGGASVCFAIDDKSLQMIVSGILLIPVVIIVKVKTL